MPWPVAGPGSDTPGLLMIDSSCVQRRAARVDAAAEVVAALPVERAEQRDSLILSEVHALLHAGSAVVAGEGPVRGHDPGVEERDAHARAVVGARWSRRRASSEAPVAFSSRLLVRAVMRLGEMLSTSGAAGDVDHARGGQHRGHAVHGDVTVVDAAAGGDDGAAQVDEVGIDGAGTPITSTFTMRPLDDSFAQVMPATLLATSACWRSGESLRRASAYDAVVWANAGAD